jgi:GntR family transcriptional regulator
MASTYAKRSTSRSRRRGDGMIDRAAATPIYHQIFLQLRDEITGGERPFGSAMPTEQDLSTTYAVSRITARRVLDELAGQGLVERKRRVGTTVTFRSPIRPIDGNIDQSVDSLVAFGQGMQAHVIEVGTEAASAAVAEALGIAPGLPVSRVVRLRLLDGLPLGQVLSYVPASFAASITPAALETHTIRQLLAQAGHRLVTSEQMVGAVLADAAMAEVLQIEPRSALLRISRTAHDAAGTAILLTYAYYRSDRFQLRLDLSHFGAPL